jgi:hypothetical protein
MRPRSLGRKTTPNYYKLLNEFYPFGRYRRHSRLISSAEKVRAKWKKRENLGLSSPWHQKHVFFGLCEALAFEPAA